MYCFMKTKTKKPGIKAPNLNWTKAFRFVHVPSQNSAVGGHFDFELVSSNILKWYIIIRIE